MWTQAMAYNLHHLLTVDRRWYEARLWRLADWGSLAYVSAAAIHWKVSRWRETMAGSIWWWTEAVRSSFTSDAPLSGQHREQSTYPGMRWVLFKLFPWANPLEHTKQPNFVIAAPVGDHFGRGNNENGRRFNCSGRQRTVRSSRLWRHETSRSSHLEARFPGILSSSERHFSWIASCPGESGSTGHWGSFGLPQLSKRWLPIDHSIAIDSRCYSAIT